MWLLILLLAAMASGCPDLCECEPQKIVCQGKLMFGDVQFDVPQNLTINGTNESGIEDLFNRLQNGTGGLISLGLINSSLSYLNVSWSGLEDLRQLNLSLNRFEDVRHAIGEDGDMVLTNLTVLDLFSNRIEVVKAGSFTSFTNLLWLRLRNNTISKVDEQGFEGLNNLEHLDLADNKLDTLPSGALVPLDALQKLDLSGNKLQVLGTSWFETLTHLRELDVSRNGLAKAASGALEPLSGLSVLRLAGNPLKERDVSLLLGTGRRLETVDASRTGLMRVPAALTRSVRALRLAGNKLMSIRGGDLDSYPLLRLLDLSNNNLTIVEEDALGRLEILEDLNLSGNLLSKIPRSLPSSLICLKLSRNVISSIEFDDLEGLYNLRNLSLNDNSINVIVEGSLTHLPALNKLDISRNPIKFLSANALRGPNNLAILYMSGLSQLNDQGQKGDMVFPVPAPERLLVLDISQSPVLAAQLLNDDAALTACKRLKLLNLSYTNISRIRTDLTYVMPQLQILGLSGNQWNCTSDQYWLIEWFSHHSEIMPRSRCSTPKEFAKKLLIALPSSFPVKQSSIRRIISNPSISSSRRRCQQQSHRHATAFISDAAGTLISRRTANAIRDATGISTSNPTTPLPARHSTPGAMRTSPRSQSSVDKIDTPELRAFRKVFLTNPLPTTVLQEPVVLQPATSNDIAKTIAQELNGKVTDPNARLAEPFAAGPHPGMLVLAGAALGAAAVLTVLLSRRVTRRQRDQYHRHENIEVHSLTPTTERW